MVAGLMVLNRWKGVVAWYMDSQASINIWNNLEYKWEMKWPSVDMHITKRENGGE
jgi:hypothetical protein